MSPVEQLGRFAVVGLCGTAAHYILLVALVEIFGIAPVIATGVGFVAGASINYSLNRVFTFNSATPHLRAAPKFLLIALIGAGINTTVVLVLTERWHQHYLFAQVVATVIVLFWNFLANRYWTFRDGLRSGIRERA